MTEPRRVAGGGTKSSSEMRMARSAQEGVEALRDALNELDKKIHEMEKRLKKLEDK